MVFSRLNTEDAFVWLVYGLVYVVQSISAPDLRR